MNTSALRLVDPVAWRPRLTGDYPGQRSFIELGTERVPLVFCWCPSDEPERMKIEKQRPVDNPDGFWLAQHPVNQQQWQAVMGTNPSKRGKGDLHPVDSVSWNDAQEFCQNAGLRLPKEAEWEFACRAGTSTPFGIGAGECLNAQMANFDGNHPDGSGREAFKWLYREGTLAQGRFPPNAWGLHDMHGQLWEWCEDEIAGRGRVLRGGSWIIFGGYARSAFRDGSDPENRDHSIGFRPCPSSTEIKDRGRKSTAERGKKRGTSETMAPRSGGNFLK